MLMRLIKKIVATLLLLLDSLFLFSFILAFFGAVAGILFGRTHVKMFTSLIMAVVYLFLIAVTIVIGDKLWEIITE
jgi:hypothetical protein